MGLHGPSHIRPAITRAPPACASTSQRYSRRVMSGVSVGKGSGAAPRAKPNVAPTAGTSDT